MGLTGAVVLLAAAFFVVGIAKGSVITVSYTHLTVPAPGWQA